MDGGWIKLHRRLLDWEWYDDTNAKVLFLHLLLSANHKPKQWRGLLVKDGQVVTGVYKLSKSLGLSPQQIRTALNKLKSTNEITIKTTNKYSIVTICKYTTYQMSKMKNNNQTNEQTTNNQQTINNKQELKNVKNKRIPPVLSLSQVTNYDQLFIYWEQNKSGRKYKNEQTRERMRNKLSLLTYRNLAYAKEAIQHCIDNGYVGFCNGSELYYKRSNKPVAGSEASKVRTETPTRKNPNFVREDPDPETRAKLDKIINGAIYNNEKKGES